MAMQENENINWLKDEQGREYYIRKATKEDMTLTEDELKLIENYSNLEICCACCQEDIIQKIIKRPFSACGTCYCCAGDYSEFDDPEFVENNVHIYVTVYRDNNNY